MMDRNTGTGTKKGEAALSLLIPTYNLAVWNPVISCPPSCSFRTISPAMAASSASASILALRRTVRFPQGQVLVLASFGA